MSMTRADHREIARVVSNFSSDEGLNSDQQSNLAERLADVCDERTLGTAKFAREAFIGIANIRQ